MKNKIEENNYILGEAWKNTRIISDAQSCLQNLFYKDSIKEVDGKLLPSTQKKVYQDYEYPEKKQEMNRIINTIKEASQKISFKDVIPEGCEKCNELLKKAEKHFALYTEYIEKALEFKNPDYESEANNHMKLAADFFMEAISPFFGINIWPNFKF